MTFEYMSRAEWQARAPRSVRAVLPHQFSFIEFHHSASSVLPAARAARSFQDFHMDTKRWQDLFYNWLIHPDGTIVEGRSWGTSPRPENSMTICFIGNYEEDDLTEEAKEAARILVTESRKRMPQLRDKAVRWHNMRAKTACPGRVVESFVRAEQRKLDAWTVAADKPEPAQAPVAAPVVTKQDLVDVRSKVMYAQTQLSETETPLVRARRRLNELIETYE